MKTRISHKRRPEIRLHWLAVSLCLIFQFTILEVKAQDKVSIQVKTFDTQLRPYKNLELSINGKSFISTGSRATTFTELDEEDLPIKTIWIKDANLETASWNYSKGTLEIIVRTKSYRMVNVYVRSSTGDPVQRMPLVYAGKNTHHFTTNEKGLVEIPLALDGAPEASHFKVSDYEVKNLSTSGSDYILTLSPVKKARDESEKTLATDGVREFDLTELESVQSLTVFYAMLKNRDLKSLSAAQRRRVDEKFNALIRQLHDSVQYSKTPFFMGKISQSSVVREDVKNLLDQAKLEHKTLEAHRSQFDTKIKMIDDKLSDGVSNLDAETRTALLKDVDLLERLLIENENQFFENQSDYRQMVSALKEKFFDVEDLENKLSMSEQKRQAEQKEFRERLVMISGIVLLLTSLLVLVLTFSARLRKQKKALLRANAEVERINENLESIVADRTRLLAEANKELDTFLYRASHDMRSPVCSIIGLCNIASLLSQGEPKELIQRVVDTTEGMDRLLKKLSSISEINQPTNYSDANLYHVVSDVTNDFQEQIRENKIKFDISCPDDLVIHTYPGLLETVISNALENALFFSTLIPGRDARVKFHAQLEEGSIVCTIEDNGIGIERTIKHRLYDMFYKGTEKSKGHGLGLYIVAKALQALHGEIQIDSVQGESTKVTIKLPLQIQSMPVGKVPELVNDMAVAIH